MKFGLTITPLDVVFFRDGKPFGDASHVESISVPMPQVGAGALTTELFKRDTKNNPTGFRDFKRGKDAFDAVNNWKKKDDVKLSFSGVWFAKSETGKEVTDVYVPVPANLMKIKVSEPARYIILSPKNDLPGWDYKPDGEHKGRKPLWHEGTEDFEAASGFLNSCGLCNYLKGIVPDNTMIVSPEKLFTIETRIGIEINPKKEQPKTGHFSVSVFCALKKIYAFTQRLKQMKRFLKKKTIAPFISILAEKAKRQMSML